MAYSFQNYTSDGERRDYAVPFIYIKPEYVKVYGCELDAYGRIGGERFSIGYEWINPGLLRINTKEVPPAGYRISVERETFADHSLVDYQDAAQLCEPDLELAAKQALHVAQEARDRNSYELLEASRHLWSALEEIERLAEQVQDTLDECKGIIKEAEDFRDSIIRDVEKAADDAERAAVKAEEALAEAERLADKVTEIANFDPDFYVSEDELREALDDLAVSEHTHEIDDIDGLPEILNDLESRISEAPDGVVTLFVTGDGVTTEWALEHQLGTMDVEVFTFNMETGGDAYPGIFRLDPNTVKMIADPAIPSGKVYRVCIKAPVITSSPFMRYDKTSNGWVFNALVPDDVQAASMQYANDGIEFIE